MSENYKPGTVAVATVRGVEGVRVLRRETFAKGDGSYQPDWAHTRTLGLTCSPDESVTNIRPLVVLDLAAANPWITEDEAAEAAIETLRASDRISDSGLAAQIEAQTRPPKPAEPTGLGAVVEDEEGTRYVLAGEGVCPWIKYDDHATSHYYADLNAVRVLSEGVEVDR